MEKLPNLGHGAEAIAGEEAYWVPEPCGLAPVHSSKDIAINIHDTWLLEDGNRVSAIPEDLRGEDELEYYLDNNIHSGTSIRAIHICQPNSWSNLPIDSLCLDHIKRHHNIMPEYDSILSFFTSKRNSVEEALCGPILQRNTGHVFELAYVLKYPECKKKAASGTESWVIRQLGVYQQYDKSTSRSLWIFLHCRPNSVAQERLTIALNNPCAVKSLQHYPIVLHLFLSSCYLNNWRSYMTYYDMELLKKSNAALGARLEDLPRVSYDTITNLRFLENKLATLPAIFSSLNLLFSTLETTMSSSLSLGSPYKTQLALYSSMIHSYHSNVSVLLRRCSSLSEFIVESTSHTQNGLIVRMAEASVKDSASIKVITIVTLAYLPASFVATFFGMQFFELSLPRLWIFFSLAAVLTIVTLGLWWWSLSQQGKSNKSSGEVLDALDVEKAVSTIPGYKAHVN